MLYLFDGDMGVGLINDVDCICERGGLCVCEREIASVVGWSLCVVVWFFSALRQRDE